MPGSEAGVSGGPVARPSSLEGSSHDFSDAVSTVLTKKYADVKGRARRCEYWWYYLAYVLALAVLSALTPVSRFFWILELIFALAVIIPGIAVAVRRLHDTSKSGWFPLLALIRLVGAIMLIVFFHPGQHPRRQPVPPEPEDGRAQRRLKLPAIGSG